jgi:hypothetical protein
MRDAARFFDFIGAGKRDGIFNALPANKLRMA